MAGPDRIVFCPKKWGKPGDVICSCPHQKDVESLTRGADRTSDPDKAKKRFGKAFRRNPGLLRDCPHKPLPKKP